MRETVNAVTQVLLNRFWWENHRSAPLRQRFAMRFITAFLKSVEIFLWHRYCEWFVFLPSFKPHARRNSLFSNSMFLGDLNVLNFGPVWNWIMLLCILIWRIHCCLWFICLWADTKLIQCSIKEKYWYLQCRVKAYKKYPASGDQQIYLWL